MLLRRRARTAAHRPSACAVVSTTLASLLALLASVAAHGQVIEPEDLSDEHVRKAIDAMVETLYAQKDPKSFWDPPTWDPQLHGSRTQGGGYTALAVLALLSAGESYQNPNLRDAVEHLAAHEMTGTYAVAVRTLVWAKLPPRFAEQLERDATWMMDGFSNRVGGWTYEQKPSTNRRDNSLRQYGALALWEAAKRGIDVDRKYWRRIEQAFLENQHEGGGWNYKGNDEPPTGSMTAAGLATLYITQDLLHANEAVGLRKGVEPYEASIERGLTWMNGNFSPTENPGSFRDFYYYLYGVERIGLASGRRTFQGTDWYRAGAAELIRRICGWNEEERTMTVHERVSGSGNAALIRTRHLAFALMFLSRGRVPVAINKLEAPGLRWNNRPRDVANLCRWITTTSETDLSWQIVGVDEPAESWLDAPLLYLASDEALPWTSDEAPQAARLREYVELGGTLLTVNEGRGRMFADSVERLGRALFPAAKWRDVGETDPAYTLHSQVTSRRPRLRALSNGVRDLIVLCPGPDLAATFQRSDEDERAAFESASNLYYVASDLNRPRPRLARHAVPAGLAQTREACTVIRGRHGGNWNPEPRALTLFARRFARDHAIDARPRTVALTELKPGEAPLAVISGVDAHALTADELAAVRRFADAGGVVLIETAGGREGFALAVETQLTELLGARAQSLVRHPIVTGDDLPGAHDLSTVEYRAYSFDVFGSRETTPRLRGIEIDGRVRILFSREDLSNALLDQPAWGVHGYTPETAQQLMENVLRYAAGI